MNETKEKRKEAIAMYRARNSNPYFEFTPLEPTSRLYFDLIDNVNFLEIFHLFHDDKSPFVSEGYKNLEMFKDYIEYQLSYLRYSAKRAGCDWVIYLKETNECIGIINLFELSQPGFSLDAHWCMVGFAIQERFRRKGYAFEALIRLLGYTFDHFQVDKIVANTEKDNWASKELLKKAGFKFNKNDYTNFKLYDYFELTRENCFWNELSGAASYS